MPAISDVNATVTNTVIGSHEYCNILGSPINIGFFVSIQKNQHALIA